MFVLSKEFATSLESNQAMQGLVVACMLCSGQISGVSPGLLFNSCCGCELVAVGTLHAPLL